VPAELPIAISADPLETDPKALSFFRAAMPTIDWTAAARLSAVYLAVENF
jgi:hypothetical protein